MTLATQNLAGKITWSTVEDLGSDHLPIVIEISNEYTRRHPQKLRRRRWRRNKADWEGFAGKIEEQMEKMNNENQEQSLKERVKSFNEVLIEAGKEYVGKTVPKKNNCWMTPDVRTAVKKRNRLRREVGKKRKEWLEACEEAQRLMDEARQKAWEDYLSEVEYNVDPSEIWRLIRSIGGTPDSLAPNEALIVKGRVITTNPKKADAFAKHYAGVSKLTFSKTERERNRSLKKRMKLQGADDESCCDFDMKELDNALKKMKTKGAPGKDDIPPSFLKNIGPLAKKELLDILNTSFRTSLVPSVWRHAIIIPLIKVGKPGSQLSSYRPISLT